MTVMTGGQDGGAIGDAPADVGRAALGDVRDSLSTPVAPTTSAAAAGAWPGWAEQQLHDAVALAAGSASRAGVVRLLYRDWWNPPLPAERLPLLLRRRPLAGLYRSSHAGSALRETRDGIQVVGRHDVVGTDGWWRTWGDHWMPPRRRRRSTRVLLTPQLDRLPEFVHTVTAALLPSDVPWTLACATDPGRLRRHSYAVLDLPGLEVLPLRLLAALVPLLRPVSPPLCLPLAPGASVAEYPDNGMSFGEHRCHLVSLGLRHASTPEPLSRIAEVFLAHGIAPAQPHRGA